MKFDPKIYWMLVRGEGFEPPLYYSPPECKSGALDQLS